MIAHAMRNLRRRPTRAALAVVGMTVALMLVVGLIGFSYGLRKLIDSTLGKVSGLTVVQAAAPDAGISRLPLATREALAATLAAGAPEGQPAGVIVPQVVAPVIALDGQLLFQRGLPSGGFAAMGMDLAAEARLPDGGMFRSRVVQGRYLEPTDADGLVISTDLADKLGLQLGSTLRLPNTRPLTVIGLFESGSRLLDLVAIVPLAEARKVRGFDDATVSCFFVQPPAARDRNATAERIGEAHPTLIAYTPEAIGDIAGELLGKLDTILIVITVLPILGAAAAVANTMMMSFHERVPEFGVLIACGWRRRHVLRLVLAEAALLGLAGGVCGAVLGAAATLGLGLYLELEPVIPLWLYPACLALAIGLGMTGGAYPAYRAAGLSPMEAIRRG